MNSKLIQTVASVLALSLAIPPEVVAEVASPPPANAPQQPAGPVFKTEEIDQMTAPIALYPDDLVAQVLMAATYPLEVVQAERWASDPANAQLKGDQLAAALEPQTWDPSVKSLVPFPQVLKMMSDKLDWTQRLGDAFLAQQADVMASIQKLRHKAQDAGNLKSTEQQKVVVERETVVIQPANPEVVYVPTYNPTVVYGSWPYPAYPPVYYPPVPAYYPGYVPGAALASGLAFGLGVAAIGSLSGWGSCNWGGNTININGERYNNINRANIQSGRAQRVAANSTSWRHDPSHRGGVAYRDAASRQDFGRQGTRPDAANRNFRGYDGQRGLGQGTSRPPGGQRQTGAAAGGRQLQGQAGGRQLQNRAGVGAGGGARAPSQRTQPSAFQGMGSGAQTRAQADRGRASRQSFQSQGSRRATSGGGGARMGGGGARGGGGRGGRR